MMGGSDYPFSFDWCTSEQRFIVPLNKIIVSKRLKRRIRSEHFEVTMNDSFTDVVDRCAERPDTWINLAIKSVYQQLFENGLAHSIETWKDGVLVGGLIGIAVDRVFFGESMFARKSDASKVAFIFLVDHLNRLGFKVLDAQVPTTHLASMGAEEISEERFQKLLSTYIKHPKSQFTSLPFASSGSEVVQRISQKS